MLGITSKLSLTLAVGLQLLNAQDSIGLQRTVALRSTSEVRTNWVDPREPGGRSTTWVGDALVTVDHNATSSPVVHAFDATGGDTPAVLRISGTSVVHIEHATHTGDGTVAAVGEAYDSSGKGAGFVALISPDRQTTNVIRMAGHFLPQLVALAPDGTIWTKGWEPTDVSARYVADGAPMVRHLDRSGNLISGYFPQGTLSSPRNVLTGSYGFLVVSSQGIGWSQKSGPYYEIGTNGSTITQYPGVPLRGNHEFVTGISATESGDVFASTEVFSGTDVQQGLYLHMLDRGTSTWRTVSVPASGTSAKLASLVGRRGDSLVFDTGQPGLLRFYAVQ